LTNKVNKILHTDPRHIGLFEGVDSEAEMTNSLAESDRARAFSGDSVKLSVGNHSETDILIDKSSQENARNLSDEELAEELKRRCGDEFVANNPNIFSTIQAQIRENTKQNAIINKDDILEKLRNLVLTLEEIAGESEVSSEDFIAILITKFRDLDIKSEEISNPKSNNFTDIANSTKRAIEEAGFNTTRKDFLAILNEQLTQEHQQDLSKITKINIGVRN
jgi:hypothetical protein